MDYSRKSVPYIKGRAEEYQAEEHARGGSTRRRGKHKAKEYTEGGGARTRQRSTRQKPEVREHTRGEGALSWRKPFSKMFATSLQERSPFAFSLTASVYFIIRIFTFGLTEGITQKAQLSTFRSAVCLCWIDQLTSIPPARSTAERYSGRHKQRGKVRREV